jgi:hypothetical protein
VGQYNTGPYVDQNIWSSCTPSSQTLDANSPNDFQIVANYPAGNTGVCTYPNTGDEFSGTTVDSYNQFTSSFSETFPHNAQTTAWSMYDLWFNNWANEVMIQYDFSNNGPCTSVATAQFGGTNGVPVQTWHLCDFGSTLDWKLGASDPASSESSGSIDIKAMIQWLENNAPAGSTTTYLPANTEWTAISDGWEICSTGGQNETFSQSGFTVTAN